MSTFGEYFRNLARYEGRPAADLVSRWDPDDRAAIASAFRTAFQRCNRYIRVPRNISAPALGNRIATGFVQRIGPHLKGFQLADCPGSGYPDKRLVRVEDSFSFVLEIKAKTSFNPGDWKRVVITSTTMKLRRLFVTRPICHLLATVFHDRVNTGQIRLRNVRLDFLEPSSLVEQRFEGSVSHHLLARSDHEARLLVPEFNDTKPTSSPRRNKRKRGPPRRSK